MDDTEKNKARNILRAYAAEVLENSQGKAFLGDASTDKQSREMRILKAVRYKLYVKELQEIEKTLNRRKIDFIVMKGISLAQRLYAVPWLRDFGDIDILVCPENLGGTIKALEKMGYICSQKTDKASVDCYLEEIEREHHFPPFIRNSGSLCPYVVEVHVDIVPAWMFQIDRSITKEIMVRKRREQGIPLMDKYDELIFQMLHLVKHYIFEMTLGFIGGDIHAQLCIRDLYEIVVLLEKWEGNFEICQFEERAREYTVENEIMQVVKWLREIEPSLESKFSKLHLFGRRKGCFANRFCGMAMDIQKILCDDPQMIATEAIERLQKDSSTVMCSRGGSRPIDVEDDWIKISNSSFGKDNRFGTYLTAGKYREDIPYKAYFRFLWDESNLYFHIRIDNPAANFYSHVCDMEVRSIKGYDYVRLHFDTGRRGRGEPFVRALNFKPYFKRNGGMGLFVEEEFNSTSPHVLRKDSYWSFVEKRDSRYYLAVGIPWEVLHYQPRRSFEIHFDLWLRTDDFIMQWQSAYHAWYDIAAYGKLILL